MKPDISCREPASVTEVAWQQFSVSYTFPVYFTSELFNPGNPVFKDALSQQEPAKRHRVVVFLDNGLVNALPDLSADIRQYMQVHAEHLELLAEPVLMPAGERIKSDLQYAERMQKILFELHVDRHSYVVGVGGGALLDAVGLVAATSHRGIRHVRVPTTVLSQNDSGVGVKNSLNLFGQKNYLGTFAPPYAVLNDDEFIQCLPARDKIAGMAEAVKVALIRDADFYRWLEDNVEALAVFRRPVMNRMIRRCAELHMAQIAHGGDPFETGSARPLDFGHWSAHRLETLTGYQLRHGEAVAIGIALDTRYSVLAGLLEPGSDERVCLLLERLGFHLWHQDLECQNVHGEAELLQGLTDFREHLGGELTITLLSELGSGVEVNAIDETLVSEAIGWLKHRNHDGN